MAVLGLAWLLVGPGTLAGQPGDDQRGSIEGLVAKFVDVQGVRTRYYDYGTGEPIVLVHGGGMGGASTANNFSRNIRGLAERFRVIALDRLTQGMTGYPKDDADLTRLGVTKHLYQFMQTLKLDQIHLVGHSSGGGIVINLAAEHPEIIKTLTVVTRSTPAEDGPRKFEVVLKKECPSEPLYVYRKCRLLLLGHTPETFSDEYAAADDYMGNLPKSVEGRRRMEAVMAARQGWLEGLDEAYAAKVQEKVSAGALNMPVLIFGGKQDPWAWSEKDAHAMMRGELRFFDQVGAKNPRVKLIVFNEAGHFLYREHPEQFNADLIDFIDFWSSHSASN